MAKVMVLTPKEALVQWAKRNAINPVKLAEKTGYSYMHCWSLLRGETAITVETLGRLVLAFGAESVAEITEAMRKDGQNVLIEPRTAALKTTAPKTGALKTTALKTAAPNGKR